MPPLTFHDVDESRWGDFERLFAGRGGPKYCWCMVWRATGGETRQTKGPERKAAMAGRVRGGGPIRIPGYLEDGPVAWGSIPPPPTHPRLGRAGGARDDSDNGSLP